MQKFFSPQLIAVKGWIKKYKISYEILASEIGLKKTTLFSKLSDSSPNRLTFEEYQRLKAFFISFANEIKTSFEIVEEDK